MKNLFFAMLLLPAVLFPACGGDDDNNNIVAIDAQIKNAMLGYIQTHYEGAVVKSMEVESNGLWDVDIMHDNVSKDVYFTQTGQWVLSKWNVAVSTLPALISNVVYEIYPDYIIDDADFVQSPGGDYYSINIEKGNIEKDLRVALDGSSVEEI